MFTRMELEKLHLHFHHPSSGKLYNLLRREDPENTDPCVQDMLKQITKACANCSELYSSPFRFRTSIPPDELQFNHELDIDMMWISGQLVLHIIDTHTLYQMGELTKSKSAASLYDTFVMCWDTIFIGYPGKIRLDREPAFDSEEFWDIETEAGMTLQ